MQLRKLNIKKFFLVLLVFFLIILKFFDTPYNLYSILNWNYNERMEQKYGNCKNESWGFYKTISDKFNLERDNIKIINEEGHVTLENLFNIKKDNSNDAKYFILVLSILLLSSSWLKQLSLSHLKLRFIMKVAYAKLWKI